MGTFSSGCRAKDGLQGQSQAQRALVGDCGHNRDAASGGLGQVLTVAGTWAAAAGVKRSGQIQDVF